jgi:hypothetical protein
MRARVSLVVTSWLACSSSAGPLGPGPDYGAVDAAAEAIVDAAAEPSLIVVQDQVPLAGCVLTTDTTIYQGAGVYDVALDKAYPYNLYPLLRNRADAGGVAQLSKWSVSIEGPAGLDLGWPATCAPAFDVPDSLVIQPGGMAAATVEVLHRCHGQHLRDLFEAGRRPTDVRQRIDLMVSVRARGRQGATELSSPPFVFPVRACYGCLQIGFPNIPACSASNPNPGHPCNPGQDQPIQCCALEAQVKQLQCPAPGP